LTGPEDEVFDDIGERVSSRRRPGEDEMAYFERRYQERVWTNLLNWIQFHNNLIRLKSNPKYPRQYHT